MALVGGAVQVAGLHRLGVVADVPGPVADGEAVHRDLLPRGGEAAGDPAELVEVAGLPLGDRDVGLHHGVEAEVERERVTIDVGEVVGPQRLATPQLQPADLGVVEVRTRER